MKRLAQRFYPDIRSSGLLLLILLGLSACSTYGPSHNYPPRSYVYQPGVGSPYHPGYSYYDSYQPGWSVGSRYPGSYYGAGYGPMAYWPTYSYSNHYYTHYSSSYYPYYDYSNSYYYRPVYGYGYNPYYRHGNYSYRPYYGGSHSYRPPGNQDYPSQNHPDPQPNRPAPVVIPRDQRGRRTPGGDYGNEIVERPRQPDARQPDRRSVTVVTEPRGMSRSVSASPAQRGHQGSDQGMVVSNRSERKVQNSRLHSVVSPSVVSQPGDGAVSYQGSSHQSLDQIPAQPARNFPAYQQPPAHNEPATADQPSYQQPLNSGNVIPRAGRRQHRDSETDPDSENQR